MIPKRPSCYGRTYSTSPSEVPPLPDGVAGLTSSILKKIDNPPDIKDANTVYRRNAVISSVPKPTVFPSCRSELDGYEFDDFIKWYRAHGWTENQINVLLEKKKKHDNSIEDKNAHLDAVLSRYNGKSTTTKKTSKPIRSRFKIKSFALQVEDEEDKDQTDENKM